jgi:hypothetical protein
VLKSVLIVERNINTWGVTEVLYNLLWLFEEMRWYWLYYDY